MVILNWKENSNIYTNATQPFKLCIMISHLLCCLSPTHLTINYILLRSSIHKNIKNHTSETMIHSKHRHIISMKNLTDACGKTTPRKYNEVLRIQYCICKKKHIPTLISAKWTRFKLHGSREVCLYNFRFTLCFIIKYIRMLLIQTWKMAKYILVVCKWAICFAESLYIFAVQIYWN